LRITYVSNTRFPWCTQTDVTSALRRRGYEAVNIQEDDETPEQFMAAATSRWSCTWRRVRGPRVNAAADLLAADVSAADAARALADRFGCSLRQAHRYMQHAGPSGHVQVPEPLVSNGAA
jgi:hypothetical protein